VAAVATSIGAGADKSIAVLPFADDSERKDQAYFADGLSDELIDMLAKIPGLRVPARTSSFYFKGRQATPGEIGEALNAANVLEGSVRKSGPALRISAELIRIADETRIWSDTYDRKLDDVFKVQDDIAGSVVAALKVSMLGEPKARAAPTSNSEAYLHYLRAEEAARPDSPTGSNVIPAELEKAIALDPSFAEAWRALGSWYLSAFAGAGIGTYDGVHRDALNALQRALALDPRNVAAVWLTGYIANSEGRFDEAIAMHKRGPDIDPLAVDNYRQLGNARYRAGRLDAGAAVLADAARRFPATTTLHYRLGLVLLAQQKPQAALAEFAREQQRDFKLLGMPLALDRLGRRAEADSLLAQAVAVEAIENGAAYQVAIVYAARGDTERAFHWLERAYRQRDAGMHWMKYDPLLQPLK
jgi:TolB-like protein/tetratricopeptide (TPR) repeat protein